MSGSLRNDPVYNAIYHGIKRGIQTCLDGECFGAATILIYSGIDAMAFLSLPASRNEVKGDDFMKWCDRYIQLPGPEQIQGVEFYGARCAMLHTYGVESKLSRNGKCRMIGYMERSDPAVHYDPNIDPNFLLLSVQALADAFFAGIDRCLVDLFSDREHQPVIESRLNKIVVEYDRSKGEWGQATACQGKQNVRAAEGAVSGDRPESEGSGGCGQGTVETED